MTRQKLLPLIIIENCKDERLAVIFSNLCLDISGRFFVFGFRNNETDLVPTERPAHHLLLVEDHQRADENPDDREGDQQDQSFSYAGSFVHRYVNPATKITMKTI